MSNCRLRVRVPSAWRNPGRSSIGRATDPNQSNPIFLKVASASPKLLPFTQKKGYLTYLRVQQQTSRIPSGGRGWGFESLLLPYKDDIPGEIGITLYTARILKSEVLLRVSSFMAAVAQLAERVKQTYPVFILRRHQQYLNFDLKSNLRTVSCLFTNSVSNFPIKPT